MRKIRIALLAPIVDDPTSWYRGFGPYDKLCKEQDWQLTFPTSPSWASLKGADVAIFQRPAMPEHFGMLALAKNMGIKTVVDFDDDNLSVPKDNPTYPQYAGMPVKEAILNLARHCDVLQVSTKFLKDKYGIYNKNTHIIPNALDDDQIKTRPTIPGPRENKLLWRGNQSQMRNLGTVSPSLVAFAQKHPEFKLVFFGHEPFEITERVPNHEIIPPMSLVDYFVTLPRIKAKLLFYPLHNQDHSQARSHISWLEATYASTPILAYRNEEFNKPGCLTYNSITEFEDTLERVASDAIDLDKQVEISWTEIRDKYLLSKTNEKRLALIESLL